MTDMGTPRPIAAEALREHFVSVYRLTDEQAAKMIKSAAKSIHNAFELGDQALGDGDLEMLSRFGHNLKGLFMNMGQPEWAEVARSVEQLAKANQLDEIHEQMQTLKEAVEHLPDAA